MRWRTVGSSRRSASAPAAATVIISPPRPDSAPARKSSRSSAGSSKKSPEPWRNSHRGRARPWARNLDGGPDGVMVVKPRATPSLRGPISERGNPMPRMSASEAFVETLAAQGVTEVFGIVGSAYMDALDLFPAAGIRFIPTVHEQGAAHMADGYARVSGRHGVCIAQNGPGITNFVTAIAAA